MSQIEEEDDSQNPPSHVNQIIRTNNFLIHRLNGKYTPSKKSESRTPLTEDSVKSEQIYRETEQKQPLQMSQADDVSQRRDRSKKSVFEKYNIPETKTVKQKNNRTSIRSKLSNCNSNQNSQTRGLNSKRAKTEMHCSSNTIKKAQPGSIKIGSEGDQKGREQFDKWGFKRVESTEINRELFKRKSPMERPLQAKVSPNCRFEGIVTEGLDQEILNSEFSKIRFSNLNQVKAKVAAEEFKRKSLNPVTVHLPPNLNLSSKKSEKLNSVISLKDSDTKKKRSKMDILKKYGIVVGKKAKIGGQNNVKNVKRDIKLNSIEMKEGSNCRTMSIESPQLGESGRAGEENSDNFEYMKMRSNEQLEMDSKLPRELDKQFKKMMSMEIGKEPAENNGKTTTTSRS